MPLELEWCPHCRRVVPWQHVEAHRQGRDPDDGIIIDDDD